MASPLQPPLAISPEAGTTAPLLGRAGRRRPCKPELPLAVRKQILVAAAELKRQNPDLFRAHPELKRVCCRLFRVGLEPRRRSGRPCDPVITQASVLFTRRRKTHPDEPVNEAWQHVYRVAIPDFDVLSPRARSAAARNLRSAVRSRRNIRRRRKPKQ
jgi:hypothetical protein